MWKQKILHLTLILVSVLALTGFSPNPQGEKARIRITQIDTSDFPQVTVYVAVTSPEGDPLGVDPARIQLLENGQPIPFDQIQGAGEIEPLTVLLAMDISGSMLYVGKLEAAKAAAKAFVAGLRPADKVGLLTFQTEIDYIQEITADRELINTAIDHLEAAEDTAMYDALLEGIEILSEVKGRAAMVVITDGLDTVSDSAPADVLRSVGPSGLSISTIGLGDPDQDLAEKTALDVEALQYLAENAGGVYGYANDINSLTELYQSYAASFKSEFQLTYTSPSALRDGVNRALSVSLSDDSPIQTDTGEEAVIYNPGGLVPEVSQPVPLGTFGLILAALALLLFLPGAVKLVLKAAKKAPVPAKTAEVKKPRIKLKD